MFVVPGFCGWSFLFLVTNLSHLFTHDTGSWIGRGPNVLSTRSLISRVESLDLLPKQVCPVSPYPACGQPSGGPHFAHSQHSSLLIELIMCSDCLGKFYPKKSPQSCWAAIPMSLLERQLPTLQPRLTISVYFKWRPRNLYLNKIPRCTVKTWKF